MGYLNYLKIAVTKRDFRKLEDLQMKMKYDLLYDADIHEYKENNIECVFIELDCIEDCAELDIFKENLNKLKDGYVLYRAGDLEWDEEFRNASELSELMKIFKLKKIINQEDMTQEDEEEL